MHKLQGWLHPWAFTWSGLRFKSGHSWSRHKVRGVLPRPQSKLDSLSVKINVPFNLKIKAGVWRMSREAQQLKLLEIQWKTSTFTDHLGSCVVCASQTTRLKYSERTSGCSRVDRLRAGEMVGKKAYLRHLKTNKRTQKSTVSATVLTLTDKTFVFPQVKPSFGILKQLLKFVLINWYILQKYNLLLEVGVSNPRPRRQRDNFPPGFPLASVGASRTELGYPWRNQL